MQSFDNPSVFGDRPVIDAASFINSTHNTTTISFGTPGRSRASSAPRERTSELKSMDTPIDKEKRQQTFREFISRQVHQTEKKIQVVPLSLSLYIYIYPSYSLSHIASKRDRKTLNTEIYTQILS